jgi:hypothetical protein
MQDIAGHRIAMHKGPFKNNLRAESV